MSLNMYMCISLLSQTFQFYVEGFSHKFMTFCVQAHKLTVVVLGVEML